MKRMMMGILAALSLAPVAHAKDLQVQIASAEGPLAEAVIWVEGKAGAPAAKTAVLDQIKKAFVPFILPVQVGTTVDFPNSDPINHHVYSFSPAKRFDMKLFKGQNQPHTLVFDQAGIVTVGCNIHDWMLGYVVVIDGPWFAQSDGKGEARLSVPDQGPWRFQVFHPRLGNAPLAVEPVLTGDSASIRLTQALKPDPRQRRVYD
ncbi:MAG: methylamine utilization protein [Gammaproteobacteria bacterium]|nr:methylamine utilization protein [Gammaproteobacteria bacterium]